MNMPTHQTVTDALTYGWAMIYYNVYNKHTHIYIYNFIYLQMKTNPCLTGTFNVQLNRVIYLSLVLSLHRPSMCIMCG